MEVGDNVDDDLHFEFSRSHVFKVHAGRRRRSESSKRAHLEQSPMERLCELCAASRPVVYCQADAAHLCLSCDAKIHSANALFKRHVRCVVCDSCRYRPAYVQCLDHKMFVCRVCDGSLHISSQHQKQATRSYTGCPSAKDFAALWGFELKELDSDSAHLDETLSTSCASSSDSSAVNLDSRKQSCSRIAGLSAQNSPGQVPGAESKVGSSSQQNKISHESQEQKSICFVLRQIIDLKMLQLAGKEQSYLSSSAHQKSKRVSCDLDRRLQHSQNTGTQLRQRDTQLQDRKADHLQFPFSQPDHHITPSSTAGLPLHTEPFWQCRSPVQSSQLWAHNMQDIGVCEELVCPDDFKMPDVDATFQNYEELFGGDQDPIRPVLVDGRASATVEDDASEVSPAFIKWFCDSGKDNGPNKVENLGRSIDAPYPIRPSYSTLSFCNSRFSAETGGTHGHDGLLSPCIAAGEASSNSSHDNEGGRRLEVGANTMMKSKEKKHSRLFERKNRYPSRKAAANILRRGKGRVVKRED